MLFPFTGAVTGLLTFLAFYFLLPSGAGNGSGAAVSVIPVGAATPKLSVVAADGSARVSWTAPGVRASRYVAQAVPDNTALPQAQCVTAGSSCIIGGLTDGVTYTVNVSALNGAETIALPASAKVAPYPAILTSSASSLWLNADDIPAASGTPVSFWPDESGRDNNAKQTQVANQPVLSTLGSNKAVRFYGDQNLIYNGNLMPSGSTPSVIFAVAQLDDPHAATACFEHLLSWGTGNTGLGRMLYKGCQTMLAYAETFNAYALMHPTDALSLGQPVLLTAEITGSGVTVLMNGSPDYSSANPPGVVTNTRLQSTAMVGGAQWWGNNDGWIGRIGEIIVLSGNVSAGNTQAVDDYLLRKWDIAP